MSSVPPSESVNPNSPSPAQPNPGNKAALGLGQIALILGVVALVLGASALGVALTGTGHTGARGPAGPGAVLNQTSYAITQAVPNDTCTAATGSSIGFTVGGPGVVTLTATVALLLDHTNGDQTTYSISLANAAASCDVLANKYVTGNVDYSAPTAAYVPDVSLVQNFPVGAAGIFTLDVVGNFTNFYGVDSFNFNSVSVAGVFYPA